VQTLRLDYWSQYERTATQTYPLAAASVSLSASVAPRTSCRRHRRVCKVNADGVKHVAIEMQGLLPFGRLPLALVIPPYGAASSRGQLVFANEPQDVEDKYLSGGKHRYTADLKSKLGNLSWEYDVSNSVALTHEELSLLPSRAENYPNIISGKEEACAFVPTFPCESLELEAHFERAPAFQRARALVERRADHGSGPDWEVDEGETDRVQNHFTSTRDAKDHNVLTLTVADPLVDHRYSLVFEPGSDGRSYPSEAKFLAKDVLAACRDEPFQLSRLRADLTLTVGDALKQQLGGEVGEWVAHLWHADDRILLPAFGEFPSVDWSCSFEAGSGIAGHAFRHSSVVGWCHDGPGSQTVYRKGRHVPGYRTPEHKWVLCLPLRLGVRQPAIGVVGLARAQSRTAVERCCEDYARGLADQPQGNARLDALVSAVTVAFWAALTASKSVVLTRSQRDYAQARLDDLQEPLPQVSVQP